MASIIPHRILPRSSHLSSHTLTHTTARQNVIPTRRFTLTTSRRATITASPKTKLPPPPPRPRPQHAPKQARNLNRPPQPNLKGKGQPSNSSNKQDISTLLTNYRWPLLGAGLTAAVFAFYLSATITATLREEALPCECAAPTGRPGSLTTAQTPEQRRIAAEQFDQELRFPEWYLGVPKLRGQLAERAVGHVLEVAVGTGRNLGFYDWEGVVSDSGEDGGGGEGERMASFTGVDISGDMLAVARDRLREAVPGLAKLMRRRRAEPMPEEDGATVVDVLSGKVRLVMGDAESQLPPSRREGGKYDTIVQTFGLCSVADPAKLLANAAHAVKPDTGRIVLLEHGRGWFEWMNRMLDRFAGKHFAKYGCWWNRDIERLVREAEKSVPGLEVVYIARPWKQAGTTLYIELKVNSTPGSGAGENSVR